MKLNVINSHSSAGLIHEVSADLACMFYDCGKKADSHLLEERALYQSHRDKSCSPAWFSILSESCLLCVHLSRTSYVEEAT